MFIKRILLVSTTSALSRPKGPLFLPSSEGLVSPVTTKAHFTPFHARARAVLMHVRAEQEVLGDRETEGHTAPLQRLEPGMAGCQQVRE